MQEFSFYLDNDENAPYKFGYALDYTLRSFYDSRPLISYNYLDIGTTEYHFQQTCFDQFDSQEYFKQLKKFTNCTLKELVENSDHHDHFRIDARPKGKLLALIQNISGKTLANNTLPILGHFALYTNENSNRKAKVKSPRIFFLLGKRATMHMLFYDPYHEIHVRKW